MIDLPVLLLIFAVLVGSTGMMGVFGYLISRVRRLEAGTGEDGDSNLLDEIRRTRRELAEVKRDLVALGETVDFTERLLAEPRPELRKGRVDRP